MMNRRLFLLSSAGSLLLARPAFAAVAPEDLVARKLVEEGFRVTSQKRTLLGRVRILAKRGNTEREVVVDPSSGEVLRDYSRVADNRGESSGNSGGTGGTGGGTTSGGGGGEGGEGGGAGEGGGGTEGGTGGETSGGGEPSTQESTGEPVRESGGTKTRDVPL